MEKSRIFVASSGRTLLLAEKLRDEMQTDFCYAALWSEEGKSQPSETIVEMLERATLEYDFAVVILARDDVMIKEAGGTLKARDNCVFEAGLFMAALGRERCFLVNSVEQRDLPSDLGGVISLPFQEPADLGNRQACAEAMRSVSATLKDVVQRVGRSRARQRLPLLSVDEVFSLERPQSEGGDLNEGQVLVCDIQPMSQPDLAPRIRHNLDQGVSYMYFLQNTTETIEKVVQSLQGILVAGLTGEGNPSDFEARLKAVENQKDRVVEYLRRIYETRCLLVTLLPDAPQFRFRLHNASDRELARLYMKYRGQGFVLWAEGAEAVTVWNTLPRYVSTSKEKRVFVPLLNFELMGDEKRAFKDTVDRALAKYFPGIEEDVRSFCFGINATAEDQVSHPRKG